MTLYDLLIGHFTWHALLADLLPLIIVLISAFYAGYWRGRVIEQRKAAQVLDELQVPK